MMVLLKAFVQFTIAEPIIFKEQLLKNCDIYNSKLS